MGNISYLSVLKYFLSSTTSPCCCERIRQNCPRRSHRRSFGDMREARLGMLPVAAIFGVLDMNVPLCPMSCYQLANTAEKYLEREYRETGRMMIMKRAYVEYVPLGVIGKFVVIVH